MQLRLSKSDILHYASDYPTHHDTKMKKLQPIVKQRGYLTPDDLLALSNWKLRGDRAAPHIKKVVICTNKTFNVPMFIELNKHVRSDSCVPVFLY